METALTGFFLSGACTLLLYTLFRYEARRGSRYFESVRGAGDQFIIRVESRRREISRFLHSDFLYQTVRYVYNVALSFFLKILRYFENRLQVVIRHNRRMAKRAEQVRTTRNKLDEIAEHKVATALSERDRKRKLEEPFH